MKRLMLFALSVSMFCGLKAQLFQGSVTENGTGRKVSYSYQQPMDANYNKCSMQGAAIFKNVFYQFYDKGAALMTYNLVTGERLGEPRRLAYDGAAETHFGSVAFSNRKSYVDKTGKKVKLNVPLAYVTGHMKPVNKVEAVDDPQNYLFVDVVDVENDKLVERLKFRNRYDDAICAWDFKNKCGWVVGYVKEGYALSPYMITEFKFGNVDPDGYVRETNPVELPNDGTLQDCSFSNGRIYFMVGWGSNAKRSTLGKIHVYNVKEQRIESTVKTQITDECEGFALDKKGNRFIITSRCIYGNHNGQGSWWNVDVPAKN